MGELLNTTDPERERLRESVEAARKRWLTVCAAYERGEISREDARAATLDYDMAQALLDGNVDVIRAVDIERERETLGPGADKQPGSE